MKKKKGGIGGFLISVVSTLIAIGVVLAALQLSEVNTLEEAWELAKEKSKEYSECIPNNTCGLVPILNETINKDGEFSAEVTDDERKEKDSKEIDSLKEDLITVEDLNKNSSEKLLKDLKVVKKEESVDYDRKEWKHWIPYEGKSCWNVREEVLKRDSIPKTINFLDKNKVPTQNENEACSIGVISDSKITTENSGEWIDPYSGDLIKDSSKVDIDHIIPLSKAAKSGGQNWSKEKKEIFANDLENLLATSAKENRKKGDKGPGEYMPPNKDYHCQYAKSYISIAYKYSLTINEKDSKVLNKTIKECSI